MNADELQDGIKRGDAHITVKGEIRGMPMLALPPGQTLTGRLHFGAADGVKTAARGNKFNERPSRSSSRTRRGRSLVRHRRTFVSGAPTPNSLKGIRGER